MRRPQTSRRATRLRSDVVEIAHAGGVDVRERATLAAQTAADPGTILGLRPLEGLASLLSGGPALAYRSGDLEIALTPDECLGLVVGELDTAEASLLARTYGDALEWNASLYDAATLEPRLARGVRGGPTGAGGPDPDAAAGTTDATAPAATPAATAEDATGRDADAETTAPAWVVACRVGTEAAGQRDFLLTGETHPSGWDLWSDRAERGRRHATSEDARAAMAAVVIADLRERCRVTDGSDLRMTRRG